MAATIAASLLATPMNPASAHISRKTDPQDADVWDISRTSFRHGPFVIVSMLNRYPWQSEVLASDDPSTRYDDSHLWWQIDTNSRNDSSQRVLTDYVIELDYRQGRLKGTLYRWVPTHRPATGLRRLAAPVRVWRDGRRAFAKVRKSKLRSDKTLWGWSAESPIEGQLCKTDNCDDQAPDNGLFRHKVIS